MEDSLDLYDLQLLLKESLEEAFPSCVWVRAELSSVQVRSNGHCYLELSQSEGGRLVAKAHAVIWRSRYLPLSAYFREVTGSGLEAGMSLMLRAQVNYSELYGLSLIVDEVEPQFTLGQAELQRQRTLSSLKEEGLLELQKELPMSALPFSLAVISARDAAGYGDFCRHLQENEYGFRFRVDLFEALMQGASAPASIVSALERVEGSGAGYDAVLIMRGGGSVLDLSCFDDYSLCAAIARFPLPVFTAIGHDRDMHVADMVAFESVKTPTALADFFIDIIAGQDERLTDFQNRLRMAFAARISGMEARLELLVSRIRLGAMASVGAREAALGALASRIAGADPRQLLARGYSLAADASGRVLKSASGVSVGDKVSVRFADGTLECLVEGVSLP